MYAMLTHKVQDYAAWRPYYDADEPRRQEHGINTIKVLRAQDDPNNISIFWQVADPAEVEKMGQDPQLQEVIKKAGVLGQPEVVFYNEA